MQSDHKQIDSNRISGFKIQGFGAYNYVTFWKLCALELREPDSCFWPRGQGVFCGPKKYYEGPEFFLKGVFNLSKFFVAKIKNSLVIMSQSYFIGYAFVNRKKRKLRPNSLLENDYFAVDGILPMEAILRKPFMCVHVAIIATLLRVTLWRMDGAASLKCYGYKLESWLAWYLDIGSTH